jgi:hypothetical protein
MKTNFLFIFTALLFCSCAREQPKTPVNIELPSARLAPCMNKPDGFDQAGYAMANGSRFIWNETGHFWEVITSDEMKVRATKLLQKGKQLYNSITTDTTNAK